VLEVSTEVFNAYQAHVALRALKEGIEKTETDLRLCKEAFEPCLSWAGAKRRTEIIEYIRSSSPYVKTELPTA
jgi:hypothetical protein